jgi:para-nitrobenzyl esterase
MNCAARFFARFAGTLALATVSALTLGRAMPAVAAPLRIDGGLVEGITLPSGVRAWLGVPFAAPPVRELRWKAPQPVVPWTGVLHAERVAPMCLQALRSRTMNHYFGNEGISEDCLYLNVWAPARGTKLPVLVWIYGGGFNVGSASMANYSGEALARNDVVRVNLAYRVGALGFLAHPELSRDSGGRSGNQGLADQIAGLQWVQRNIAAFGGDPRNVTIVGQSAGSTSVALLQASPAARGLFHRVVGMSGSPFAEPTRPVPLAQGESEGLALQKALGVNSL